MQHMILLEGGGGGAHLFPTPFWHIYTVIHIMIIIHIPPDPFTPCCACACWISEHKIKSYRYVRKD